MPSNRHYVILDLAGHGDSTIPSAEEFEVTLDNMTDHLHQVKSFR